VVDPTCWQHEQSRPQPHPLLKWRNQLLPKRRLRLMRRSQSRHSSRGV